MKKIVYIVLFIFSTFVYSQEKGITYQAVIYLPGGKNIPGVDIVNSPMSNRSICLKFSFVDASSNVEYEEVVKTTTDEFGMVNLIIGTNTQTGGYAGSFADIVWDISNKKLKVALDSYGNCTSFEEISDNSLSSVPFAYATVTAENVSGVVNIANGGTGATTAAGARVNLGLGNVDNTTDTAKPISSATQTALNTKENAANKSLNVTADGTSDVKFPSVKAVKTYIDSAITNATIADADAAIKGKIQLAGDLSGTASLPTVPGLSLKENAANKSLNVTTDGTSDVKFPSVKAVKTYVDSAITTATIVDADAATKGKIQLAGDLSGTATLPTVPGLSLKENIANKSLNVTTDGTSDVKFPSVKAVKTYVDTAIAGATIADADAATKGKIQLAGDLSGTAALPTITANAITTSKVADNAITDAKIATVSGTKITGNIIGNAANVTGVVGLVNGGTGATTATAARTNLGLGTAATNNTSDFEVPLTTSAPLVRTVNTISIPAATATVNGYLSATDFNTFSTKIDSAEKAANNGVATLGNDGKIPSNQIPAISFQSANVVTSQAAMIAIAGAQVGSIAIRTDVNKNYVLSALPATTLSNWLELSTPTAVTSVNGNAGPNVSLTKSDIVLGNVDNTSDINKPISTATQAALALKANLESPTFTGTVSGITKAMVGLGNVDNTSDAAKPISTATQIALDLKANAADVTTALTLKENTANKSATTTLGTSDVLFPTQNAVKTYADAKVVDGITDAVITSAPTQNAVFDALALKANLASPTFTGTVSGIDKTMVGLGNVENITDAAKPVSDATQTALNLKANTADVTSSLALKENIANKSTATDLGSTNPSDVLYPSQKAVKAYVDIQSANAGVADSSITSAKILDGTLVTDDFADGSVTPDKISGVLPINKGGTGAITDTAARTNLGLGNVDNTSDATKPVSAATQTALDLKANAADVTTSLVLKENAANKSTTTTLGTSDVLFPTQNAVKTYADAKLVDGITDAVITSAPTQNAVFDALALKANTTDVTSSLSLKANTTDVTTSLALKANATDVTSSLATKEDAANKSTTATLGTSDQLFPTQNAVKTYTDAKVVDAITDAVTTSAPTQNAVFDALVLKANTTDVTTSLALKANLASPTFTGTVSGIDKTMVGLGNVENTALSTWSGSNNLTTVGTISSGTWNGSIIDSNKGGAGTTNGLLKADGTGVVSAAVAGTDYQAPITAAPAAGQFLTSAAGGTYSWTAATSVTGVPYTGATGSVDLGAYDINAKSARFIGDIYTIPPSQVGSTSPYDNTNYKNNNGLVIHTYNQSGFPSLVSFVATGKNNGNYRSSINFLTRPDGAAAPLERLRITAEGRVGIGIIAPTTTLDVVGDGKFSTDVSIGGTITSGTWGGTVIGSNKGGAGTTIGLLKADGTGLVSAAVAGTDYQLPLVAGSNYLVPNAAITGATKTKITYDSKGLVTAGADATTADISPSTDKNYVTDAQATVLSNTSGANTGDQTITLTGDVTGTGTGSFATTIANDAVTTAKIVNEAITYAKIQNVAADKVLGRSTSGSGVVEEIATTGTGDVVRANSPTLVTPALGAAKATSVEFAGSNSGSAILAAPADAGSAIITLPAATGTLVTLDGAETLKNKTLENPILTAPAIGAATASTVSFAGATSGSSTIAAPDAAGATNIILPAVSGTLATLDGVETLTNKTLTAPELGEATATSINKVLITQPANNATLTIANSKTLTVSDDASVSGSNTGDQTTITGNAGTATKLAAPVAINGVAFDGSAPITVTADAGTLTGTELKSTVTTSSLTSVGTLANLTVTNPIAGSITGNAATATLATTATNLAGGAPGSIPYQTAAATTAMLAKGTDGKVLTLASGLPSWETAPGISSVGSINATAVPEGAVISSGALKLAPADGTNGGVVTNGTQTFGGAKTFTSSQSTSGGDSTTPVVKKGITITPTFTATGLYTEFVGTDIIPTFNLGNYDGASNTIGLRVQGANIVATGLGNDPTNTAIGTKALNKNTTTNGGSNTAIGKWALLNNTSGTSNTAIGSGASSQNTTGTSNVAIGDSALRLNTSSNNVAIGNSALENATSGSENIAIGNNAAFWKGSSNMSGYSGVSGSRNIFIGYDGRPLTDNDKNEIVIGSSYNSYSLTGNGSNTTSIGNPSTTSTRLYGATLYNGDSTARSGTAPIDFTLKAQDGNAVGQSNTANSNGGNINLTPGQATGTAAGGSINLNVGTGGSTSGTVNVNGKIKIIDGNQAVGKVLTSDANGLASWTTPSSGGVSTLVYDGSSTSYVAGGSIGSGTLTIGTANSTSPGFVSAASQTFGGFKTFSPTITAASGSAVGTAFTPSLTAAANNNALIGVDINPYFSNGSYTGLSNYSLRVNGTANFTTDLMSNGTYFGSGKSAGNVAIGSGVLMYNTSGNENIGIGTSALRHWNQTGGGNNIAIGGYALGGSSNAGFYNIAIGQYALGNNTGSSTTGSYNTAIGIQALQSNTTGKNNTVMGYQAMSSGTNTNSENSAFGMYSLKNTTGGNNSGFGSRSLNDNTSGNDNSAFGSYSLYANTAARRNTAMGAYALRYINGTSGDLGAYNIGLGYQAGASIGATSLNPPNNTTGQGSLFIGYDTRALNDGDTNEVVISGFAGTAGNAGTVGNGSNTTTIGNSATTDTYINGNLNLTGKVKIAGGSPGAGKVLTSDAAGLATWATPSSSGVTSIGAISGTDANAAIIASGVLNLTPAGASGPGVITTGTQTIAGDKTFSANIVSNGVKLGSVGGADNVLVGGNAMNTATTSDNNTAIGSYTLNKVTSGNFNVALGYSALYNNTTGRENVAIGSASLNSQTGGGYNVAVGNSALKSSTTASYNVALGYYSGYNLTTGSGNTALGTNAGLYYGPTGTDANTTGSNSTLIGYNTSPLANGDVNELVIAGGSDTRTVGLGSNTTLIGNSATSKTQIMGALNIPNSLASSSKTTGALIVKGGVGIGGKVNLGENVESYATTEGSLVVTGGVGISGNLNFGGTLNSLNTKAAGAGSSNTAYGVSALGVNTDGGSNTAIGYYSLKSNTSGDYNTGLGYNTLINVKDGTSNVAIGHQALSGGSLTSGYGSSNVAVGNSALSALTSGASNVALGNGAGSNTTTGSKNIYIGASAGSQYADSNGINTTTSNSVLIGWGARPSANGNSNEVVISGVDGTNKIIGLGTNTTLLGNSATTNTKIWGALNLPDATVSSSSTTGALTVGGGAGIAGNVFTGASLNVGGSNESTSTSTGAIKTSGGIGAVGSIFSGGIINVSPSNAASGNGKSSSIGAQNGASTATSNGGNINLNTGSGYVGGTAGDVVMTMGTSTNTQYNGSLMINTTSNPIPNNSKATINMVIPVSQDGLNIKSMADGNNVLSIWQTGSSASNFLAFMKGDSQTVVGTISASTTATTYNTASDYRLKTDFKDFKGSKLLDSIKVYDYQWKIDGSRSFGVKAHELQKILPYAVSGEKDAVNADGSIKAQSVDYSKLVPVLIKALQEQETQIKDSQTVNTQLKEQLELLKEQLEIQNKRFERLEKLINK